MLSIPAKFVSDARPLEDELRFISFHIREGFGLALRGDAAAYERLRRLLRCDCAVAYAVLGGVG